MIDLAIIAATPHLAEVSARGSIDMALTHLVLEDPAYAEYFLTRSQAGVRVILDNSAYEMEDEFGQGLPAGPVLKAAERIGASVIICHDVLYDGPATVTTTAKFVAEAAGSPYELMAVPQGRSRAEWLNCHDQLTGLAGVSWIGLSKLSVPASFGAPNAEARLDCVDALTQRGARLPLHLLGGDRSLPWELTEHVRRGHEQVHSNDSSFAYWYAVSGMPIDRETGRAAQDAPTKPDLRCPTTPVHLETAKANVAMLRAAAGLTPGALR